jgi:dTDP-glucose 4,6-dehydratase
MSYGPEHITEQIISDLEEINTHSELDLREIVNSSLVITGASGFIGTWLTLSWVAARKKFEGSGRLLITSRNPESLIPMSTFLDSENSITVVPSDIRAFVIPEDFKDGYLIHAATPASAALNKDDPLGMLKNIIEGQERVISEAVRTNCKMLFLSSGAVYGRQPLDLLQIPESWSGAPEINNVESAYHEGKRIAELMGYIAAEKQGLHFVSARLFAFIAPFLPLGTHFAAGNFIRDAINSNEIEIMSGGGSVRSYLYATDLCSQLWALLVRGANATPYNVGSNIEVTIRELANAVVENVNKSAAVVVRGIDNSMNVTRYVPSIEKMKQDIVQSQTISLDEALSRTAQWLGQTGV